MACLGCEVVSLLNCGSQSLLVLTLSPNVGVKPLKRKGRLQETFSHLVTVAHSDDKIFLFIVRCYGLRPKEVQVDKLIPLREIAEGERLRVAIAQDQVELREVAL